MYLLTASFYCNIFKLHSRQIGSYRFQIFDLTILIGIGGQSLDAFTARNTKDHLFANVVICSNNMQENNNKGS